MPAATSFPLIKYTREKHRPDTRYFGPYTDSRAGAGDHRYVAQGVPHLQRVLYGVEGVRRLLRKPPDADLIGLICAQKVALVSTITWGAVRACAGMIDADSYAKNVRRVERFVRSAPRPHRRP